ncbi:tRNA (cytidine(34)-2'-O)-methyltransferase [Sphingobium sufflavum]|uniref:tRNA (cytidine(34)-2'-O)-methyltransferase n=1 Tax=Sphingobium sufflavum TaxID=1129547 RepID=UPI001F174E71|nr:TrmH family RNA methyltransferase [Sphingobium sufflavum]MCE7795512.1 tRNA (cytidine(34)-2'-O)-methyltransferase [Sphingobium sufflavum]
MRLALFQPDIAGNVGAIMRLAACWQTPLDIILPCGFALSDKQLKRAAMDYGAAADVSRHADFAAFEAERLSKAERLGGGARLIALTSGGDTMLHDVTFAPGDILLLGQESAGLPGFVQDRAEVRVRIPMATGFRSLNLGMAAGIALGEALRQTKGFPA